MSRKEQLRKASKKYYWKNREKVLKRKKYDRELEIRKEVQDLIDNDIPGVVDHDLIYIQNHPNPKTGEEKKLYDFCLTRINFGLYLQIRSACTKQEAVRLLPKFRNTEFTGLVKRLEKWLIG
jgi:hypothetical protein